MQFANPIWLAGLSGILIPLAIHLLSRKEGKVIRIGSIRHFEETSTRQFKSIKLNEILLLVLRSLLIVLIVFLLAGLQWPGSTSGKTNWLLIEKGLENDTDLKKLIDSLTGNGFEKRALAKGFPIVADSINDTAGNYWPLVESLKKEKLDSIVIISANRANGFRGEQKTLPINVAWITKSLPQHENVIESIKLSSDSAWVRSGKFTNEETAFSTEIVAGNERASAPDTVYVTLVSDKEYEYEAKLLLASLNAIDGYVPHTISLTQTDRSGLQPNHKTDWIFWMSDEKYPDIKTKLIALDKNASSFLEQQSSAVWSLTQRVTPESVVEENLTSKLARLLFPETKTWQLANDLDVRTNDEQFIETQSSPSASLETVAYSGEALWIFLIILTFLTERFVSYKRMQ